MSKTITLQLTDTPANRKVLAYLLENVTTQELEHAMAEGDTDMMEAWQELECRVEDALDA